MALTTERKSEIVGEYSRGTKDTGSPEVQVALLSARINELGEHFTAHKRDHPRAAACSSSSTQRRKLLDYLKDTRPGPLPGSRHPSRPAPLTELRLRPALRGRFRIPPRQFPLAKHSDTTQS